MKRLLCVIALAAVVLLPDWASACWRRGRVYDGYSYPVAYRTPILYRAAVYRSQAYQPIYYASQPVYVQPGYGQPVYVQPQPQNPPTALHQPRVVPETPKGGAIAKPEPAPAPENGVRPATGSDIPTPLPAKPDPAPTPPEPKRGGLFEIPKNLTSDEKPPAKPKADDPKIPPIEIPTAPEKPKLPPLELPKGDAKPKLPPLELPKDDAKPKLPPLEPSGTAVPAPAPPPDSLIPPPNIPAPKNPDSLPPLTLPPDTPVAPSSPKETEAKSSPLTTTARELKVSVFPAAGSATAGGLRKIGFYNHTKRDLALTIEGKTVTLPAMSYLHAQLPPTFTWKCADKPAAKETVPADATGLDVVIRE